MPTKKGLVEKRPLLKATAITARKLRAGKFKKELPEFFVLREVIENNGWHNHDSVFNHILTVREELEKMLDCAGKKMKNYLATGVENYSRREILLLAVLLHDIAKTPDIMSRDGGAVTFPGHEEAGARQARIILDRFDLTVREKTRAVKIVRNHGALHGVLSRDSTDLNRQVAGVKNNLADIFWEIVLCSTADTRGSQLRENDPEDFNFRDGFCRGLLASFEE